MSHVVKATYENGVLKLDQPLPLKDKERVRVTVESLAAGDRIAIAPQVLAEFIHIVTDARRFTKPLSMDEARHVAEQ